MTDKEAVLQEIDELPQECIADVLEYVRRLKMQAAIQRSDAAIASETVLAKDWLRSEEDDAWRDL
ncbi:MAG TPA: hypothetical protein VN699_16875 [Pirellulales bacterium]|nr:hypothetical protein [Pirellulales bacterium]